MNNDTNNPANQTSVTEGATPRRQVRFAESFGTPELEDSPSTTPPSSPALGNGHTDTPVGFTVGPAAFAIGTPSPAPRRPRARQAAQEAQVLARFAGLRLHGPTGPVNTTPTIQRRRVITEPLRQDRVPLATMGTVALTTSRNGNLARARRVSSPIRPFVDVDEEEEDSKGKRNVRRRRGRKPSCGGYPGFVVFRDPEDDDDNKENIPPPMAPMLGRIR